MIAIDGVAPQAKMCQQRTRRFMSAHTERLRKGIEKEVLTVTLLALWAVTNWRCTKLPAAINAATLCSDAGVVHVIKKCILAYPHLKSLCNLVPYTHQR